MERGTFLAKSKKFIEAYDAICKPYCQELGISIQAFKILITIANNKNIFTANDICKEQNIKPTLMSFHVEKLVEAGYLERQAIKGNRRSIKLVCTKKADPIIEEGQKLHKLYLSLMWDGVTKEEAEVFSTIMKKVENNVEKILNNEINVNNTK